MFSSLRNRCAASLIKCAKNQYNYLKPNQSSQKNALTIANDIQMQPASMLSTAKFYSTSNASASNRKADAKSIAWQENEQFMAAFPDVVRELSNEIGKYDTTREAVEWLEKAMHYNVPRGKKNRGLATVLAYKTLCPADQFNEADLLLANYLGWCVEMLQAMFLIQDDIMDGSETRRGDLCWYKLDNVNLIAINDGIMIESAVFHILKRFFREKSYYTQLMDLFHEATLITTVGQSLDMQTALKDVTAFTAERHRTVVTLKTSYYTFYLPVALGMHMVGHSDPILLEQCKHILLRIGDFFQIQDDYMDCYGDPKVTGKIGTDIQDNKCSWCAVTCMERANDAQKQIMIDNYGQKDEEKVRRVKELYNEIGLPGIYEQYERESYEALRTEIEQLPNTISHTIFYQVLDKIYRRES